MRTSLFVGALLFLLGAAASPERACALEKPLPLPKRWVPGTGVLSLGGVVISTSAHDLANEVDILREQLERASVTVGDSGPLFRLEIAPIDLPEMTSLYAADVRGQAYRVEVTQRGVQVQAATPAGILYGIQSVTQLIEDDGSLPCVEMVDWPDLAIRGVMVDPARANENATYYERLIRFCGRFKINRIHVHLTDDQNVCLFHEDYRPLMHPHAWTPDRLDPLVRLARRFHIELIPEIESLGHARVFLRHPEFKEVLHQTTEDRRGGSWVGTEVSGYTNVLCPASPQAYRYLDRMYARAAQSFPFPEIHLGCDEVDMTNCARCEATFPGVSHAEWFVRHVLRCRDLAAKYGRRTALWGDMLLRHREILDRPPHGGRGRLRLALQGGCVRRVRVVFCEEGLRGDWLSGPDVPPAHDPPLRGQLREYPPLRRDRPSQRDCRSEHDDLDTDPLHERCSLAWDRVCGGACLGWKSMGRSCVPPTLRGRVLRLLRG